LLKAFVSFVWQSWSRLFYRNLTYHHSSDTLHRLDFDRMGKVVLGVYESVVWLANEIED
jgi:hypothetical protein